MPSGRHTLEELTLLHRIVDGEERRTTWRRSLADLASAVSNQRRTVPLEGLPPGELLVSMEIARSQKLLDDVDWLSGPAAAAALYELAAALPGSEVKRDLGRRVLNRLRNGDASTFVAVATQLALGSSRALGGAGIRARVALALDLPIGSGTRADSLALALISRRELSREWLVVPSMGSLPSRRLAARLLERAAREAAQRAAEGDDSGIRIFETLAVREASERLLADRESLVWRHVASARGLLSGVVREASDAIDRSLDPTLGITEWRRGAASLAASIAVRPERSLEACKRLIESPLLKKDPGLASAIILGLPRAAENDPGLVEELLEQLVQRGGLEAAEALVELRRERIGSEFGAWAAKRAKTQLLEAMGEGAPDDEGQYALMQALVVELSGLEETQRMPTLRDLVSRALDAFAAQGASEAYAAAQQVLNATEARMGLLERCKLSEPQGRMKAFAALREIDLALLETDALSNLLLLGARGDDPGELLRPLADLFHRLSEWLLSHEGEQAAGTVEPGQLTLRMRRVRTLLHLVDADGGVVEDRHDRLRLRRLRTTRTLLRRVSEDIASPLHRALTATSARACDAMVREEIVEVSDVLVTAGTYLATAGDLRTMAEASMVPEIKTALHAFAKLDEAVATAPDSQKGVRNCLEAVAALANDLPIATSARVEALRSALLAYARALEPAAWVGSLMELAEQSNETPLAAFENAARTLAQLISGAHRKLGDDRRLGSSTLARSIRDLDLALERVIRGGQASLGGALTKTVTALERELPSALALTAGIALTRICQLPLDAPRRPQTTQIPAAPKEAPLPAWMPPSRTLGGFYVVRAIGTGAGGTVFVARRSEDRHNERGEPLALKVPDYSGAAARTLSENEFFQLFREEAGALLSLPQHPNIARFVTFDVGARPKPILVMELVDGPHLERLLEMGEMTVARAFDLLDGIAAGLEAMHAVGVGHLDVKPSNIIVRDPDGLAGPDLPDAPVLVDFGLAGRKMRPGCGTAEYGAPEIWGLLGPGPHAAPPADVYAFACLAFELLTGRTLFEGPNEVTLITQHISHDGMPDGVAALARDPRCARLAQVLGAALRRDPKMRASMAASRQALASVRNELEWLEWPLQAPQ